MGLSGIKSKSLKLSLFAIILIFSITFPLDFLLGIRFGILDKYFPVAVLVEAIYSGVPSQIIYPPLSHAYGPNSIIHSAFFIMSKLCSITITEFPLSIRE